MTANPLPHASTTDAQIARALSWSRFARRVVEAQPSLRDELAQRMHMPFTAAEMLGELDAAGVQDEESLKSALRRLRNRVLLRVLARDLNGLADLAEVTATVTALAEIAIRFAVNRLSAWLAADCGTPAGDETGTAQELLVVGMGKLGGRELNVSSDVDLIFLYPEEGETRGGPRSLTNHEFFVRLGRRLIAALSELTADGFVFRVDMRLRPDGESGPLAMSFAALESYFYTQGREWERYAWIKGRVIAGVAARELAQLVNPFVFRKYLDYNAFESMRALHGQVREEVRKREMQGNIKLGPGGIREIEFIAQVFQLIRGGRDPALRVRPTREVLTRLTERRLLPPEVVAELSDAYVFLRNLEHRLQYLDDRQTQTLPEDAEEQALIAATMGFDAYPALLEALDRHSRTVSRHFDEVFASGRGTSEDDGLPALWRGSGDRDADAGILARLGYRDVPEVLERLGRIRASTRYQQLPSVSRDRFDALVPALIRASARFANADQTLGRTLDLLEAISRRAAYLALLQEYPQALERVAKLAGASSWAADYLTRHPILLDELLDDREIMSPPDWSRFQALLDAQLEAAEGDPEAQMDILRNVQHMKAFRLLIRDLEGLLEVETLSDHLSYLADLILSRVVELCWEGLPRKHLEGPPRFAIIGYGKLGGKELGYASDLDLIFLHDDSHPDAQEVYSRLAMRINTWLNSYTAAGVLYDTDLRLRPDGASGLLVSPVSAFRAYQHRHAWAWEHQALTRARFVAGDPRVGEEFERLRVELLREQRDLGELGRQVVEMRAKMLEAHPNRSNLFDLKHDRGGIIDVEFIVQYLVLGHCHAYPELTANIGNLALLKTAGELGLIPAELAEHVRKAYRGYRRTQHQLRLNGETYARVDPESVRQERSAVTELWDLVLGSA